MKLTIKTESGSVYELDQQQRAVRRLQGIGDPTPRQGKDGEWKYYETVTPVKVQEGAVSLYFVWTFVPEDGWGVRGKGTMTSPVVSCQDVSGSDVDLFGLSLPERMSS